MRLLFVFLAVLGAVPARAQSCAVTLVFSGVAGYPSVAYFDADAEEPAPPEIADLRHRLVHEVLAPLAAFFRKTPEELFPELQVVFSASAMGPLASVDGELGVFSDWSPAHGITEPMVLAHELVHRIGAYPRKRGLPAVLKELDRSFTFNEFIADWIPYQAFGRRPLQMVSLPDLPLRGPDLISYDLPAGRFSGARGNLTMRRWLAAVSQKAHRSAAEQSVLDHAMGQGFDPDGELPGEESLDGRPLEALGNEVRNLDPHQLGQPLFFLLRDFENEVGHDSRDTFLAALAALDARTTTDLTFDTYLEGYEASTEDYVRVVLKRPRHLFAEFRKLLPVAEAEIFDRLYQERSIEKGLRLEEEAYWENRVRTDATELMRNRFLSNEGRGTGIYTANNRFFHRKYGIANAEIHIVPANLR